MAWIEAVFKELLAGGPSVLQVFRSDGRSLHVNYPVAEVLAPTPTADPSLFEDPLAHKLGLLELVPRALAGETVHLPVRWYDDAEVGAHVAKGRRLAIVTTLYPLRDTGGAISHFALSHQDVTVAETLRLEQAQCAATLHSIADGVIATDEVARVVRMNPVAERLTGWTTAEAAGRPLGQIFHIINEDTRATIESPADQVLREGTRVVLANHTLLVRRDGVELPIADSGAPIRDSSGALRGAVLVFQDKSDEVLARQALHESQTRLQQAHRLAAVGCWDWDLATDQIFLSEEARRLAGLPPRRGPDSPALIAQVIHPDDLERVAAALQAAIRGEQPFDLDCRIVRPDGDVRWCHGVAEVTHDSHGHPSKLLCAVLDITARKASEAGLRSSEQRYRDIIDLSPDIIFINRGGRVDLVNRACLRVLGLTAAAEVLGRPALELFHPEDHPRIRERIARLLAAPGTLKTADQRLLTPDGGWLDIEVAASSFECDGELVVQVVCRDIAERKRAEAERERIRALEFENLRIQEASRLKSEFLATMSHELRTPLNAIIGFSQLMHDDLAGPLSAQQRDFLGDILQASSHLLGLINGVLDLAKVEAGKLQLWPEPVDVANLAREVCASLRPLAAGKHLQVELEVADDATDVVLDPARLKQVLYNFLSNAIKFTPTGGRVAVRVRLEDDDQVRLEVEDSGPGIAAADLGRLFTDFEQLGGPAMHQLHPGSGLGLALTRRLVEAQGGSVGVRSSPGQGTVFFAVLPRRAST